MIHSIQYASSESETDHDDVDLPPVRFLLEVSLFFIQKNMIIKLCMCASQETRAIKASQDVAFQLSLEADQRKQLLLDKHRERMEVRNKTLSY